MAEAAEQLDDVAAPGAKNGAGDAAAIDWTKDRAGREYIRAQGRRGIIYRKDGESVADALARDAQPAGDKRPRRRTKTAHKPPPPASSDLKEIEKLLADALASPATVCAMVGDEWAANHFARQGPVFARNLVKAAENNPWLRRKLESIATAGELPMQLVTMLGVGGSFVVYIVPPVVWWLNLPVPDNTREMFGIPERRKSPDEPAPEPAPEPEPEPEPEPAPAPIADDAATPFPAAA